VTTKVFRISADTRVATAVAGSTATFRDGKARGVVLARSSGALARSFAAAPLAGAVHGPVLLTQRNSLPAATATEIKRVLPAGGTVYLLGSSTVITDTVRTALHDLGYRVVRRGGDTPAAVARSVARTVARAGTVTKAFEVDRADPTSAWVAGVAAARAHGVVLLTENGALAPETASWLSRHKDVKRFAVGAASGADPTARALTGADPAAVAVAVADRFFASPAHVAVVSADQMNAGVTSAARLAVSHGPLFYASGTALSAATSSYMSAARATIDRVDLIGSGLPYDDVEVDTQAALLG
jgi:hypothetical protein